MIDAALTFVSILLITGAIVIGYSIGRLLARDDLHDIFK